jgi:Leucine-rich repeat (LRR) protein
MRLLFAIIGLLGFSISATAANEWLYYKEYPWVYDAKTQDWLYLRGSDDGKIYAYRNSTKEWEEFTGDGTTNNDSSNNDEDSTSNDDSTTAGDNDSGSDNGSDSNNKTWDEQYAEWIKNPEPYGGLEVLYRIKDAKDSGATVLELWGNNISEILPLEGLTNLTELSLSHNNITDLSPLAGLINLKRIELNDNHINDLTPLAELTNLTNLVLGDNPITASQKAMLEAALPNTSIYWPDVIIDDSEETEKTWDEQYEEWIQNPEPYGGLEVLYRIKEAKESGATELNLNDSNINFSRISDISPLAGLTNLTELQLSGNNISDLTPLAGLKNINELALHHNNISDLSPISDLTDLTYLQLYNNNISDITPLSNLIDVRWLYLGENNITDISSLESMTDMRELGLGNNLISNIYPLAGLIKIGLPKSSGGYSGGLWLENNNISDISALTGLINSTRMSLWGNNISDSQKATLEEALPNTTIEW